MPFIRQTRDKRGFEQTYVMHVARPVSGPPRTRILYVFRTPASLNVGRTPLDAEVMEALEHTHPDLSFDWNNMTREAVVSRSEPPQPRQARPSQRVRPSAGPPRPSAPAPEPAEDASLLSSTLGGHDAARLRRGYHDLLHRIGRRARTPEDRTRLLDRAKALNPDGWVDETAIRAAASSMEAECERILAELPSRRRGRRGGRRRPDGSQMGQDRSGIMTGSDDDELNTDSSVEPSTADGRTGDDPGGRAADSETDLPVDDGRRHD